MRRRPTVKRRNLQRNRTSIQKAFSSLVMSIVMLFFFITLITSLGTGSVFSSSSINEASRNISSEMFIQIMGIENPYFTQSLPEDYNPPSVSATVFELATSIDPGDHRTLLGTELPGFSLFDGTIILAGEGVDYTEMPLESAPPMEVLLAESEAADERIAEIDMLREEMAGQDELENVVHIMHAHNRESFFPELKNVDTENENNANHPTVNITLAGERLGMELSKYGIGSHVNTEDIGAMLSERSWQYSQSYDMAREVLKDDIEDHGEFEFYFDLHRDAARRDRTTIEINGEKYAQIYFVLGLNNPNFEQNQQLMTELHERLDEDYPGLSKGIFEPPAGPGRNGLYNQDVSPNSILIEFGGVDNSLEEVYRTVEVFAEIFSDFYWDQLEEGE
ncbi:stage II sporulation protein P [Evansella cellulosilytica]|uniref:Stage II sporulation protein P n=1 Tax=Evansella cellulosilytica (strain ATCC 21833 / DSM 2522 / FERM P-1141 / JCM 9156 / N-4) TaxID=649639 RepID=E6TW22_EVAC2|nr:stage II sporulation protein P [Evansella cellulosilytica]ADU29845.1 stage II sporulation protein P [Evansella cellulosilytica DSM 2522]